MDTELAVPTRGRSTGPAEAHGCVGESDGCVSLRPEVVRELHDLLGHLQAEAAAVEVTVEARPPCDRLRQLLLAFAALKSRVGRAEAVLLAQHLQSCLPSECRGLHEIVKAVRFLSYRRTGALIVLERTQEVMPHLHGGTLLKARLSAELLECLFHPGSRLHDGAVVVRHDRIYAAGCVVAQLPEIDRYVAEAEGVGTRHRAAIGLSRATDALLIVVSEETGRVSLAIQGALFRDLDVANLLDHLQEYRE